MGGVGGAVWAEMMKSMSVPGAGLFHAHLRSPRDMGVGGAGRFALSLNIFLDKASPWTDPDSVNPDPLSMPRCVIIIGDDGDDDDDDDDDDNDEVDDGGDDDDDDDDDAVPARHGFNPRPEGPPGPQPQRTTGSCHPLQTSL